METVTVIGILASIFTGISMLPQLIKIVKEKKAKDVSVLMPVILIIGIGSWIYYGILKEDLIIIISNSVSFLLTVALIFFSVKYKQKLQHTNQLLPAAFVEMFIYIKTIFMNLIPKQEIGKQYDNVETVICADKTEAKEKYESSCKKLLQISNWGKICDSILKTEFSLCNKQGIEITSDPEIGDYIRINLSGPGSKSGEGYDWVCIEEVVKKEDENDYEFTSIKVRPAACPLNESQAIAHFFDAAATSTFIVARSKNEVSAQIHGRNEEPNKHTELVTDNVRNTVVAKFAAVKFSDIQWKTLCKGLIS